jgi:hypothetical protein
MTRTYRCNDGDREYGQHGDGACEHSEKIGAHYGIVHRGRATVPCPRRGVGNNFLQKYPPQR